MPAKLLIVDDSGSLVESTCDLFADTGYEVRGETDVYKAMAVFQEFQPDLCLLDYHMPQMSGGELARRLRESAPSTEIIFLTGEAQSRIAIDLMKEGAIDYLIKPVDIFRLHAATERALDHQRLVKENLVYRMHLEAMLAEQTQALSNSLRQMRDLTGATLDALGLALDFRDQSTSGHSKRVMTHAAEVARKLGISGEPLLHIEQGAFLHDIGKLKIPDSILLKPGPLTPAEWQCMRCHPQYGRDFLNQIDFLSAAAEIVYTHHEKFDGSGYPRGLRAEEIPIGSRIFAIVDAFDAMTQRRPYSHPVSLEAALEEIHRCGGRHFDPEIAKIVIDHPSLLSASPNSLRQES